MKITSKKSKILAIIFTVLIVASACSIGSIAMAEEETSEARLWTIPFVERPEKVVDGQKYIYIEEWDEWSKVVIDESAAALTAQEKESLFGENFGKNNQCVNQTMRIRLWQTTVLAMIPSSLTGK